MSKSSKGSTTSKWIVNNAKIKTWIMESMESSIAVNLNPLMTAKEMWDYLQKIYKQSNEAQIYQIEQEISILSQNSLSIQDFYLAMTKFWNEMDMINNDILKEALETVVRLRQQRRTCQFFMKLCSEFEHVRASILNRRTNQCIDDIMA